MRLEDLVQLSQARDMMDREYAGPIDVAVLARAAFGKTPYGYSMTWQRAISSFGASAHDSPGWSSCCRASTGGRWRV